MKNKMTFNLIIVIVGTIALIAGIMAPIYFYLQPTIYTDQELKHVGQFTNQLKEVEPFDYEHLSKFYNETRETYRIYVFDEEFNPLYTSFELGNNQKFLQKLFGDKLDRFTYDCEPFFSQADDEPSIRAYTYCIIDGKKYYINVKNSLNGIDFVFDFSNLILGYVVFGYIILCSIILYLAISPSTKAVRKVTSVAKSIADNNLSVRYKGRIRKDEIGELALSVNKMADTIQQNITKLENYNFLVREDTKNIIEQEQSKRMLMCNITHDLKTPLAVISSQIEMIHTCKDPQKKDYYYQSAMDEISKMSTMITNVLKVTADDHRAVMNNSQMLNISDIVTQLCDNHNAFVESSNLVLKRDITENLQLNTIKEYVEFIVRNYLSNAVQNANEKTAITLSLKKHGGAIRLSVENIGENIPDEYKDKIWNKNFSASTNGKPSTGLGLFIVKEISLIENTECGFENTENGVIFWFDFTDWISDS